MNVPALHNVGIHHTPSKLSVSYTVNNSKYVDKINDIRITSFMSSIISSIRRRVRREAIFDRLKVFW